jgi:hypothetical protein
VRVAVAADLARVSSGAISFAKDLAGALAPLGVVFAAATSIDVALGLQPLAALRVAGAEYPARAGSIGTKVGLRRKSHAGN